MLSQLERLWLLSQVMQSCRNLQSQLSPRLLPPVLGLLELEQLLEHFQAPG
jgi:hypothetical protein